MQTLVQVVCTRGPSLREAIAKDGRMERYDLQVTLQKRAGRQHGWTKVHSTRPGRRGALNVAWDADTSVLVCRVVTRGKGLPSAIIGDFVAYLLKERKSRVQAINIIPR